MKYKGTTQKDKDSIEKLWKSRDLDLKGNLKICKFKVEREKVDKQACRQDKHGQKDNMTITAFLQYTSSALGI